MRITGDVVGMPELHITGDFVEMPELCITGDVVGMPELCITGDVVGMPELHITGDVVGMPELHITGDVVGMPELCITGDVVGMPKLCITGDAVGMPELCITGDVVGIQEFHIKCLRNGVTIKKNCEFELRGTGHPSCIMTLWRSLPACDIHIFTFIYNSLPLYFFNSLTLVFIYVSRTISFFLRKRNLPITATTWSKACNVFDSSKSGT